MSKKEKDLKKTGESGEILDTQKPKGGFKILLDKTKKTVGDFFAKPFNLDNKTEKEPAMENFNNKAGGGIKILSAESVAKNFFESPISTIDIEKDFNSEGYLNEYYGKISPEIFEEVSNLIQTLEKKNENNGIAQIDGKKLREYLENNFKEIKGTAELAENYAIYDFIMRHALPKMLELRPDDHFSVYDVGSGPTIYQFLPLVPVIASARLGEYSENNRECLKKWFAGTGHNWDSYAELGQEGLKKLLSLFKSATPEVKARIEKLANVSQEEYCNYFRNIKPEVEEVNVFSENLGKKEETFDLVNLSKLGSVDLLTSHFCVESATKDPEQWKKGIKNICEKVNQDGFLLMTAIRGAEWYKVGEGQESAVPVDGELINTELEKNGFKILEETELLNEDQKKEVGYNGMVFILAQKQ